MFHNHRNLEIDTKFIVTDILQVKLWRLICRGSHFGSHLKFLKMFNGAIIASFTSEMHGPHIKPTNNHIFCHVAYRVQLCIIIWFFRHFGGHIGFWVSGEALNGLNLISCLTTPKT